MLAVDPEDGLGGGSRRELCSSELALSTKPTLAFFLPELKE